MHNPSKLAYTDASIINIDEWLLNIVLERPKSSHGLLHEACVLAKLAGEEHLTSNGESCLHQGLAMAEILSDLSLGDETLAAAIVYSSVQHADLNAQDVVEHLGIEVAKLIKGTCQMDAVHALHGELTRRTPLASTVDNLRKMLLAMVGDIRVVLIKLAERLCILKNMLVFNAQESRRIATETMDIYAPLAHRLGIGHLKWQLEDLSFRYLFPEEYQTLSNELSVRHVDREHYLEHLIAELKHHLAQANIKSFEVTGRAKHIYSIYKKMQKKRVTLDEVYDVIALRIIVSSVEDCYAVLGIVHSFWQLIPKEFDDYIIHPKSNGYRSIHTAVEGLEGKHVEIQIRTFDMHKEAELGVAAHWIYKEGRTKQASYEQKIACLRQVIDWQKEMTASTAESQEIFSHIFKDRIYVFTPNGDVIDLPAGATPLDFAYYIHSELGHRCRGAKVNGAIVPLTYALQSGEKVEVFTAKQGHPRRDWLNPRLGYLKTSRAKAKVLNWLRKQDHEKSLLDSQGLPKKEIRSAVPEKHLSGSSEEVKASVTRLPPDIIVEGVGDLLTYLAKCCKPVPGDRIAGYVTVGRGISVHRHGCQNLAERVSLYPSRRIDVAWGTQALRSYPTQLNVFAYDLPGLLHEVTSLLANEHIPILLVQTSPQQKNDTVTFHLTVEVDSLSPLNRLIARISQLRGVRRVQRE